MRSFRRPAIIVPTLGADGIGGRISARNIAHYERDGTPPSSFQGVWNEPDVRGALTAMQGRVCAYCGADVSEVGSDVEHFRPKSAPDGDPGHKGYWWLAYEFSNYLLSCTHCNQRLKRNRFPIERTAARVSFETRDQLSSERRVFLDPSCDPVDELIDLDRARADGSLAPRASLAPTLAARVEEVIRFFRLNTKIEHRRKRANLLYEAFKAVATGRVEDVSRLAVRYAPHSFTVRRVLELKAPHALPSENQERNWLFGRLCSELAEKRKHLAGSPTEIDRREAEELGWALAVIWKGAPHNRHEDIKQLLLDFGLHDFVAARHYQLSA